MSQVPQDIRYAPTNSENINNPQSLFPEVKPSRIIITDGVPEQDDGEILWYAIDQNTGVLYNKTEVSGGQWQGIYQFSSGAGGITGASSVGIGEDVYARQVGSLLEFKTLVSQPSPVESSVILGEVGLNEVNITAPSTVSDVINYGVSSDGWIIDSASTTVDSNGNIQLYAKNLVGGSNILIQTQTVGSEKRIVITNTYQPDVRSYIFAYLPDGQNYTTAYNVANTNDTILLQSGSYFADRQDWEVETVLGVCYLKYVGTSTKKFKCSFDVGAQVLGSLDEQEQQISFVLVEDVVGTPIVTASSTNLNFLPVADASVVQSWAHSTFVFTPDINKRYTLASIPRQVRITGTSLNIFKTNITISEI